MTPDIIINGKALYTTKGAEIEKLQLSTMDEDKNFLSPYHEGIFDGLSMMENFLDTLEVKEVDLEKKEIEKYGNHVRKN